jgi:hypothetical protein
VLHLTASANIDTGEAEPFRASPNLDGSAESEPRDDV